MSKNGLRMVVRLNFDITHLSPPSNTVDIHVSVIRKPCGCILKLTAGEAGAGGQELRWQDEVMRWPGETAETQDTRQQQEESLNIPRVRLTGQV